MSRDIVFPFPNAGRTGAPQEHTSTLPEKFRHVFSRQLRVLHRGVPSRSEGKEAWVRTLFGKECMM